MAKKKSVKKSSAKKPELKKPKAKPFKKAKPAKNAVKLADTLVKVGAQAPAFSLFNEQGKLVSLKDLKGKKVVLYFYPKDHTPGCTQESCDFRDNFARVKAAGAIVYGVSRDSSSSHEKFKTKLNLPFSLLVDEEGKMCEAYGVWQEKNLYGRKYMGIVRSTFILDEKGKVAFVYPKVSVKGHVDQVLEDLKKL